MPDDSDKLTAASDTSTTSEMGLTDWHAATSKEPPQLLRRHDVAEDATSSPFHSVTQTSAVVKVESLTDESLPSLIAPDQWGSSTDGSPGDPWTSISEPGAATLWGATADPSPGASRVPFTKREKEFLCCLIQKHVYLKAGLPQNNLPTLAALNQKGAMSSYCRVPNAAWKAIEAEYNSKDNVRPRSIKQLRKCWENLKHRGNIDPAALYSGKKLQGRTSVSGAFTLTVEGESERIDATPQKVSEGFVETCMEDDSGGGETVPAMASTLLATDLSISRRVSNGTPSTIQATENLFQNSQDSGNKPRAANHELSSRPSLVASSRLTTMPSMSRVQQLSKSVTRFTSSTSPRITNVRTVRSLKPLKPILSQHIRRRFGMENADRATVPRMFSNFSMVAKTNTQKIHEMKVKLLSTRIREHEANVQRVRLQMQHAQAQHDVSMRLLRTKAAWYDTHLRKLEKQLGTGDLSLVGEDEEEYQGDNIGETEMLFEEEFA